MSAQPPGDADDKLRLVGIRVIRVDTEGIRAAWTPPLDLSCYEPPAITYVRLGERVGFFVNYNLVARDAQKQEVWRVECKLLLTYSSQGDVADEDLQQCGEMVARQAHNYMRVFKDQLSQLMGLPRLVIEMLRPATV